jgi:hypothetical protein
VAPSMRPSAKPSAMPSPAPSNAPSPLPIVLVINGTKYVVLPLRFVWPHLVSCNHPNPI